MSNKEITITDLSEYIAEINKVINANPDRRYIYRGQKDEDWSVKSSALRRLLNNKHRDPDTLFIGYISQMIDEV